ncbi:DUF4282 domain-containing protein [Corynebacterium auriscanis]|uniref:DUF4282 domain-containing protein n=1 Tax=Corynebacterium auriscanis TaxID=99807 RepID=UPI0022454EFA|nr:DUF4282 domain-containing protein [Corynebacterium auriscanis]MCX2163399.1 DUF4282 domain-containing protein [Corynebacterium auriscanis]
MTNPNQPEGGSHPIGSGNNNPDGVQPNGYGNPGGAHSNGYGAPANGSNFGSHATDGYNPNDNGAAGFNQNYAGYGAQQQGNPQFGAYPNQAPGFGQTGVQKDSFFGALFDFSFTKYATPSVVKAVYILAMVGIGFFLFIGVIALLIGLTQDGGAIGLLLLPLLVVGGLFYLAMIRVGLEVSTAIIRTSQSVQSIDERQAREETSGQSYSGPFGG